MVIEYNEAGETLSLDMIMPAPQSTGAERLTSARISFDRMGASSQAAAFLQANCSIHVGSQTPQAAWDGAATADLRSSSFSITIHYTEVTLNSCPCKAGTFLLAWACCNSHVANFRPESPEEMHCW